MQDLAFGFYDIVTDLVTNSPDTSPVWAENEKIRYIISKAGIKDNGFNSVISIFMA